VKRKCKKYAKKFDPRKLKVSHADD
jgi:hypothetical protein